MIRISAVLSTSDNTAFHPVIPELFSQLTMLARSDRISVEVTSAGGIRRLRRIR
jgi:hypothetical protein